MSKRELDFSRIDDARVGLESAGFGRTGYKTIEPKWGYEEQCPGCFLLFDKTYLIKGFCQSCIADGLGNEDQTSP